jgi:hypothetical protein
MSSYRSTLEDLFGVRFIASGVPIERIDPSLKPNDLNLIARTKNAYVYENPRALPRVLLATEWRPVKFDDLIRDGGWPDVDPRRIVLLQDAPAGFTKSDAGGTARIAHYRIPTSPSTSKRQAAVCLCSMTSGTRGGGRASTRCQQISSKPNVLFRAVVVPPGRHVVRFTFHPFTGAFEQLGEPDRPPAQARTLSGMPRWLVPHRSL